MNAHVDKLKKWDAPIHSLSLEKLENMGIPKIDAEIILDEIEWIRRKEVYFIFMLLHLRMKETHGKHLGKGVFYFLAQCSIGDLKNDLKSLFFKYIIIFSIR